MGYHYREWIFATNGGSFGTEARMRSLHSDGEYFAFLDALRDSGEVNTVLAATYLVREFPNLRPEEAKAVCVDWRATYHERHTRPIR